MQRTTIRSTGLHGLVGLALAATVSVGCGDPCRDGECTAQESGDETDTEGSTETTDDTAETSDSADGNDETETETDTDTADAGNEQTFCDDADMDGFGDPDQCQTIPEAAPQPAGTVPEALATDCDDGDPNTFPGAAANDDPDACMTDADGDGFGDATPPNPGAVPGSDCDDSNEHTHPGAAENESADACMKDNDEDGYGDATPGNDAIVPGTDCDDEDALVLSCDLWCEDADLDGFGNPLACVLVNPGDPTPDGYVQDNSDCLDTEANAFPGAAEIDDPSACMLDADHDGWGDDAPPAGVAQGRDCDDADPDAVVCADAVAACIDTTSGVPTQLQATASGGDGAYSYAWTPVETLSDPSIADPLATPTGTTTYTVTATDGVDNVGSDEVTVHVTDRSWVIGGPDAECSAFGFLGAPSARSFSPDGTTTCTTSNSNPTAYVCPVVHEQARLTGTLSVQTNADDDIIGFVWGWQNSDQFYLLSWKQASQNWFGCLGVAGITVKRFDRQGAFTDADFACVTDTPNATVLLAPADTTTTGWINFREYGVEVLYDLTQTEITITDLSDDSQVANFVVVDDSYPSGQFGTYDFSQHDACSGPWQSSCL